MSVIGHLAAVVRCTPGCHMGRKTHSLFGAGATRPAIAWPHSTCDPSWRGLNEASSIVFTANPFTQGALPVPISSPKSLLRWCLASSRVLREQMVIKNRVLNTALTPKLTEWGRR